MNVLAWTDAKSVDGALAQLGPGVVAKAGGIDLVDRLKEGLEPAPRLVNLRTIPGLDGIRATPAEVEIGATATLARVAADPVVRARLPALAQAAGRAATPNVRAVATIAGNVLQRPRCWYFRQAAFPCLRKGGGVCFAQDGRNTYHAIFENHPCAAVHASDTATTLVAYGARVEIAGPGGRREAPLESLLVRPGEDVHREHRLGARELIVGLRVPAPAGVLSAYVRQAERDSSDWPLAAVAVALQVEGRTVQRASIVLGAAAAVPWRASGAERILQGRAIDEAAAQAAARAAIETAQPLGENGYKVPLFEALVRRAVLAAKPA